MIAVDDGIKAVLSPGAPDPDAVMGGEAVISAGLGAPGRQQRWQQKMPRRYCTLGASRQRIHPNDFHVCLGEQWRGSTAGQCIVESPSAHVEQVALIEVRDRGASHARLSTSGSSRDNEVSSFSLDGSASSRYGSFWFWQPPHQREA